METLQHIDLRYDELELLPNGLLKDYTEMVISRSPTSYLWALANGLGLLSLTAGKKTLIKTQKGYTKLICFFLIIGPSRIANKSLPSNNYTRPVLQAMGKILKKDFEYAATFTSEGIIGDISDKKFKTQTTTTTQKTTKKTTKKPTANVTTIKGQQEGILIHDELSKFIKDTKKNHSADGYEVLSWLIDGYVPKRSTKTHGTEGGVDLFCSGLCATTENFFKGLDKGFITQGAANRMYLMTAIPQRDLPRKYTDDEEEAMYRYCVVSNPEEVELNDQLEEFAERFAKLRTKLPEQIGFTPTAALRTYQYETENHTKATDMWIDNWRDLIYSYIEERTRAMYKLAALYMISKREKDILRGTIKHIFITIEAVDWAIYTMEQFTEQFKKAIQIIYPRMQEEDKPVETIRNEILLFISALTELGGIAKRTDMTNKLQWKRSKMNDVVEQLTSTGQIIAMKKKANGGRSPLYYILPEESAKFESDDGV